MLVWPLLLSVMNVLFELLGFVLGFRFLRVGWFVRFVGCVGMGGLEVMKFGALGCALSLIWLFRVELPVGLGWLACYFVDGLVVWLC